MISLALECIQDLDIETDDEVWVYYSYHDVCDKTLKQFTVR